MESESEKGCPHGDVLEQLAYYAPETNGNIFQSFREACNGCMKGRNGTGKKHAVKKCGHARV